MPIQTVNKYLHHSCINFYEGYNISIVRACDVREEWFFYEKFTDALVYPRWSLKAAALEDKNYSNEYTVIPIYR